MYAYLARRLVLMVITLVVVSLVIFSAARMTGDPRTLMMDETSRQEDWDRLGRQLGLDRPLYHQYGIFVWGMVRGDFGTSIRDGRPVRDVIWERTPATVQLAFAAFAFGLIVGIPLGVLSAVQRGSVVDQMGKAIALIGQSAAAFWLGIMLMFLFAVRLGWVPPSGRTGLSSFVLPTITIGWALVAANLRLVRSAMLDVLDSEYIKFARANGVRKYTIIWKHALRNALIPPLTFAGITLASLVTGSLVVETVFAWPGLGRLAVQALQFSDYPLLQGVVIVFTMMYILTALAVDVIYAQIDPRIRYSK